MNKLVIIGGGTFNHISCHLALAAPAFGQTAINMALWAEQMDTGMEVVLKLTKMADRSSEIFTNDDLHNYVSTLLDDPLVKIIVMNAAVCDFKAENPSNETRLSSSRDYTVTLEGIRTKIMGMIQYRRPDIVVCGFKTTHGASEAEQIRKAVDSMNANSLPLVLANDLETRRNILVCDSGRNFFDNRESLLRRMLGHALYKARQKCG
jgi:phosphopantothenoylcysteine synthetase/decarboxylase